MAHGILHEWWMVGEINAGMNSMIRVSREAQILETSQNVNRKYGMV